MRCHAQTAVLEWVSRRRGDRGGGRDVLHGALDQELGVARRRRVATAKRSVVLSSVTSTGNVEAPTDLSLSFQQSGQVTAIFVKNGEHVHAGQALAQVDDTAQKLALASAQSGLASAQASLAALIRGETPIERQADQMSLVSAQQSITQSQQGVVNAQQTAAANVTKYNQAISQAQQSLTSANAGVTSAQSGVAPVGERAGQPSGHGRSRSSRGCVDGRLDDSVRARPDAVRFAARGRLEVRSGRELLPSVESSFLREERAVGAVRCHARRRRA